MICQVLEIEPMHELPCEVKEEECVLVTRHKKYKKIVPKENYKSLMRLRLVHKKVMNP